MPPACLDYTITQTMAAASIVLRNARLYTQVRHDPWAEALAIYRDRIIWTGRDADAQQWIGPETEVIDAGRRLTLPGIIDSHFHLLRGARGAGGQRAAGQHQAWRKRRRRRGQPRHRQPAGDRPRCC